MTDVRKCDGPNCGQVASLGDATFVTEFTADSFIVLELSNPRDGNSVKHFHNDECLRRWTSKNLRPTVTETTEEIAP